MRRRLEKFRAFIFVLSILLSFSLTYLPYGSLGQNHFLASNPAWQNFVNPSQEDLATDPPYQPEKVVIASLVNPSHPGIYFFIDSFLIHFQPFSPEYKLSILRC
jgi:hypothetical protein